MAQRKLDVLITGDVKGFQAALAKGAASAKGFDKSLAAVGERGEKGLSGLNAALGNTTLETDGFRRVVGLVKMPALITGAGLAAQGLGALGAGAVAATSALAPLAGAAAAGPAVLSAYAQAANTVKLAFLGFKGGEMFKTELEKPTLAGARFGRVLKQFVPDIRALQVTAQKGLFPGLGRGIEAAAKNLPVVRKIVGQTAKALGSLAAQAGKQLGGKEWGRDLAIQGARNVTTITRLGKAGGNVANVFRHVTLAAGPLVSWMTKLALSWAQGAQAAAAAGRSSGRMAAFFETTRQTMSRVFSISGHMGKALYSIGKAAAPMGREILAALDSSAQGFSRWSASAKGQQQINKYFRDAKPAIFEMGRLLRDVTKAFLRLSAGSGFEKLIRQVRTQLLPLFTDVVAETTEAFGPTLIDAVTNVTRVFGLLAGTNGPLTSFVKTIGDIAGAIADFLEEHPRVRSMIFTLAGLVGIAKALKFAAAITGLTKLAGALWAVSKAAKAAKVARLGGAGLGAAAAAGGAMLLPGGRGQKGKPTSRAPAPTRTAFPTPVPVGRGAGRGAGRVAGKLIPGIGTALSAYSGASEYGRARGAGLSKPMAAASGINSAALGIPDMIAQGITGDQRPLDQVLKQSGAKLTAFWARQKPSFVGGARGAATSAATALLGPIGGVGAKLGPAVVRAGQAFRQGGWRTAAASLAGGAAGAITARIGRVSPGVAGAITRAGQAFKQGGWRTAASSLAGSAVTAVTARIGRVSPGVAGAITRARGAFARGGWPAAAGSLARSAVTAVTSRIGRVSPGVASAVSRAGAAFKRGGWRAAAGSLAGGAVGAVTSRFRGLRGTTGAALGAVVGLLRGQVGSWASAGAALGQAVGDGISRALSWAANKVRSAVQRMRDLLPGSEPRDSSSPLRNVGAAGEALMHNFGAGITAAGGQPVLALERQTAELEATLEKLGDRSDAAGKRFKAGLERQLGDLRRVSAFREAIKGVSDQMRELASTAAEAWKAAAEAKVDRGLEQSMRAIKTGKESAQLQALRKEERHEARSTEMGDAGTAVADAALVRDEARAKLERARLSQSPRLIAAAEQEYQRTVAAVSKAEQAIVAIKRARRIEDLEKHIAHEEQKAGRSAEEDKKRVANQAQRYQSGLESELGMLTNNLATRRTAYADFANDVSRILEKAGVAGYAPDWDTAAAIDPPRARAIPRAPKKKAAERKPSRRVTPRGRRRAVGGSARRAELTRVGELGPENVMLPRGARVIQASQSGADTPTIGTMNVYPQGVAGNDERALASYLGRRLATL